MENDYKLVFHYVITDDYSFDIVKSEIKKPSTCRIIGINIVTIIEKEIFLIKEVEIPSNILHSYYKLKEMNNFQNYLNTMWQKKGMMLLAIRDDISETTIDHLKLLIDLYKEYKSDIKSIFCVLEKSEDAYTTCMNALKTKMHV
jgi:hypothetical protein